MPIGNTPLDDSDIPLSSGLVKDILDPVLLQGSENTTADSNENISTPLNINLKQVGDALFALGQALKAASIPVTLASDQGTLPVLDTNSASSNTHLAAIDTATSDLVADLDALITNTTGLATQATLAAAKTDLDTLAGIVSSSKGAVKASASDIVDLATLLTLAGTPTDANTVNSLMGRLTKIRDLLNATLTVQGTITEANSTSITTHLANIDTDSASLVTNTTGLATQATLALAKTDLDTIVTNTNKIPASPATEGGHLAAIDTSTAASKIDLDTLAGIVSGGKGAVKSAAGDLVDLATLLTLAGTAADANTVASFMGRLTKIRDLLAATLTVQGTITEANSAASKADLDTLVNQTLTPNVSDRWARQVGQVDIARVLGAAMSATNPVLTQDQIRTLITSGQGFSATTGKQTSGGSIQTGFCLWNPSNSGKNVFIYSVRVGIAASSLHQINLVTSDPAISGITVASGNTKPGGASSVVTLEAQNTAVTTTGTQIDEIYVTANSQTEFLANGATILLPSGANNGILVLVNTSANVWFVACKWVEY